MLELIVRGHIYIAQPPLYKVKRGRQEIYVKDDIELARYLLQAALDDAQLYVSPQAPAIKGKALENLANKYQQVMAMVARLAWQYDEYLLERLIYQTPMEPSMLNDAEALEQWATELVDRLNSDMGISHYRLRTINERAIVLDRVRHGVPSEIHLLKDFFESAEYRSFMALRTQLEGLIEEGAYVQRGERRMAVRSFKEAMSWLLEEGKRGQSIQRYKGLGEMNPEQLWETTINTQTRRLLRVTIEDAIAADDIFTTLMGDQVEPRREFIERNALHVNNLDV